MSRPTQRATKTANSPSRKRLLSDPNPAASSDSALSSEPSSVRLLRMKTRDQPNLSHCHGCGLRVNATDPKDRLQTLDSVWRIVLLCRRCTKRVESAELCSYCFSEIKADCFRCRDCERRVHGECVAKYRSFAPWSYCCPELGFSVCIDCWVPKLLANSNRVYKRRRRKKKNKNNVLIPYNLVSSRVSDNSGEPRSVEDVVAVRAKDSEFRKTDIACGAGKLVDGEVELLAKKDENCAKDESLSSSGSDSTTMVVDDAELASRMHLAVNWSPRISKNLCSIESSCLTFSRRRDCNGNLLVRSLGSKGSNNCVSGKIESNNKSIKNTDGNSVCLWSSDNVSPTSLSISKWKGIVYTRRGKKDNGSWKNIDVIVGNCNPSNGNGQTSEFQSCKRHNELHPEEIRNQCPLRGDGNAAIRDGGRCNGELDRYKLKYRKRPVGLKTISRCNWKLDRYMLKYSRRHVGLKMSSRCDGTVDHCMLK